jgi:biotin carboxyl carrier protein
MKYLADIEGRLHEIIIEPGSFVVDGLPLDVDVRRIGDLPLYSLLVNSESADLSVEEGAPHEYRVILGGEMYDISVRSAARPASVGKPRVVSDNSLRAPMPGLIGALRVAVGDVVEAGQVLVVLESMKMENPLRAPLAGVVSQVQVTAGQSVDKNQILITLRYDERSGARGPLGQRTETCPVGDIGGK